MELSDRVREQECAGVKGDDPRTDGASQLGGCCRVGGPVIVVVRYVDEAQLLRVADGACREVTAAVGWHAHDRVTAPGQRLQQDERRVVPLEGTYVGVCAAEHAAGQFAGQAVDLTHVTLVGIVPEPGGPLALGWDAVPVREVTSQEPSGQRGEQVLAGDEIDGPAAVAFVGLS